MRSYFSFHNHTALGSNIRLLDSINTVEGLIDKALEYNLSGIAITDHEALSAHVEAEKYMKQVQEKNPDFKLALGNEIYLTDDRRSGQKYYHFILIAKDAIGHRALRELSSKSWMSSYVDRKLERVPTLKEDLREIVNKFPNHLIATTACIGGELPSLALLYDEAKQKGNLPVASNYYSQIEKFISFCLELFGDDFYIECAPGNSKEQITANKILYNIAKYYKIKMVVATDSHYLTKQDRAVHKAYLNSKEGDREVDSFYEFTYLMNYDEVETLLMESFQDIEIVDTIIDNTLDIYNKIERYSLFHKQNIPSVEVEAYPKKQLPLQYPTLAKLYNSDDIQDRYWVNQCMDKLQELGLNTNTKYLDELEEEARVKSLIGEKLETNMFRYPNTLQHYIDLIWECGSMVGAGRGSSCAALNHWLMGITQLDPIEWDLPFFRYLNDERVELGSLILILPSCK